VHPTKKVILLDHFLALYEGWEDDDLVKFSYAMQGKDFPHGLHKEAASI